jgi:branched-subunit amino acid aminotransferase/4-amino-4-deoxychorismate lyase
MFLWLNGELHNEAGAKVTASSAGLLSGWGVFTTIGVRETRPIAISRHFARLRRDAEALDVEFPSDDVTLLAALGEVITKNEVANGIARLTVTRRGDGRWNCESGSDCLILAHSAPPPPPNGLRVALSPFRLEARHPLAGIKSASYAGHQRAWSEARKNGFDEAVLLNSSGAVCEGTRANIFWARAGELFTPSPACGCLPGIAREIVLQAAAQKGIPAREGVFSLQEIMSADEVFLTSSTTGPRGVTEFCFAENDSQTFPDSGPLTAVLQDWWNANAAIL